MIFSMPPEQKSVPDTTTESSIPVAPAAPIVSPITVEKKQTILLILIALLILVIAGLSLYILSLGSTDSIHESTPQPSATMSPSDTTSTEASEPTTSATQETKNTLLGGLTFITPSGWTQEKVALAESEVINRYPVKMQYTNEFGEDRDGTFYVISQEAPKGGGELTILSKNDTHLGIFTQTTFEGDCGWEAMYGDDEYTMFDYKNLTVLGKDAVRPNLENGSIRIMPEYYGEPRAQYVQGKVVTTENGENVYTLPFCIEDANKKVRLDISYMSKNFIGDNFDRQTKTAKNIDASILAEMDSIVESIKFQ